MINTRKAELLAPAGSFDSLKAAVAAGADAIYMGGSRFGARAYAQNAAGEEMVEAIRYAHLHGCRLYMTVNTLFKEKELDELCDYMKPYYACMKLHSRRSIFWPDTRIKRTRCDACGY